MSYKKGQNNSKELNCSGCGTPTKVGNEAVAVKCWRCVNAELRGYKVDPEQIEQAEPKEKES